VLWQSYYAALGALGAWIAIAALIAPARWLAVTARAGARAIEGPRADTRRATGETSGSSEFGKTFMGTTESYLRQRLPPPRATRPLLHHRTRGVVFINRALRRPALRVWYGDTTIVGSFWSDFRTRTAHDSIGPDYFFRYDSLAGGSR